MKNRYRIYIRGKHSGGKVWWIQDNKTGDRESLRTTDKHDALQMLLLRNRPHQDAGFHARMARTHILVSKVFENLLEVKERKSKGSFYTPREIVHYMCQESLINYLDTAINSKTELVGTERRKQGLLGDEKAEQTLLTVPTRGELISRADIETFIHSGDQASYYEAARMDGTGYKRNLPKTIETHAKLLDAKLADIAVCDPAIGSGAFPVGMMQEIVRARSALTPYFNDVKDRTAYHFKRHAIQSCIYGVDIDPGAVEIAKLRLWLSLVVDEEDVKQIKPLPNLDYKVVSGNSLLGVEKNLFNQELFKQLEELKPKFFDESNRKEKETFKRKIDRLIHELTNGKEAFDFEIYFSEVFHRKKGFDVVIANPPYGRILSSADEQTVARQFIEFKQTSDVFVAFIMRGLSLTSAGNVLSYIIPTAWLGGPNYSSLRSTLLRKCINQIISLPFDMFEEAYVDTLVLQAQNKSSPNEHKVQTFTYPKRASLGQFTPGPWETIQQSAWETTQDKKFLLTKAMVDLAAKFQKKCRRKFSDVIEMKRGVLFDRSLLTTKKDGTNSHRYTAETAEHELNLAFHYAAELRNWFSWLDCDFDVTKPNFNHRRPDIIIHRRRSQRLNFLVVEVKRGYDVAGADEDLNKIRNHWFGGSLRYRFGASVILGEQHGRFDVRILERAAPAPFLSISNQSQFQAFRNRPRSNQASRQTLRTLANTVASGRARAGDLDDAIFGLYGN